MTDVSNHGALARPKLAAGRMRLAVALSIAMLVAAVGADALKPRQFLADTRPEMKLDSALPTQFASWKTVPSAAAVVDPQRQVLIKQLYADVFNRTYINDQGERVMVSIAYGRDQRDSLQVHKPEICYPAQGFKLDSVVLGSMATSAGALPVRRLTTTFGTQRPEPVTYWYTIGDRVVGNGIEKKLTEMKYALDGYISDGLLFRLSSIDSDSGRAFATHERFARDLMASLPPGMRTQLFGLPGHP